VLRVWIRADDGGDGTGNGMRVRKEGWRHRPSQGSRVTRKAMEGGRNWREE